MLGLTYQLTPHDYALLARSLCWGSRHFFRDTVFVTGFMPSQQIVHHRYTLHTNPPASRQASQTYLSSGFVRASPRLSQVSYPLFHSIALQSFQTSLTCLIPMIGPYTYLPSRPSHSAPRSPRPDDIASRRHHSCPLSQYVPAPTQGLNSTTFYIIFYLN